mgnify:CR=1 FL=1
MPSINNFFLIRFNESKQILRQRPRPTHRKEAPGGGVAIHPIACRRDQRSAWPWLIYFFDVKNWGAR